MGIKVRELPGWPPQWAAVYSGADKFAVGEVGVLKRLRGINQNQDLELTIEYEGGEHSGILQGDSSLLIKVAILLTPHIGRPLQQIGALEITPG